MSHVIPCLAVRNMLRSSLENFYGSSLSDRNNNCRVMPDEKVVPSCGQEFIGIFCSNWTNIGGMQYALHEETTVTVAVTHRTGYVPFDRLGEAEYIKDEDIFIANAISLTDRLREIVALIHPDYINFNAQLDALLLGRQKAYDKLWFVGGDASPKIVGPEHFNASSADQSATGLLMKLHFKGSSTLHWMTTIGQVAEEE